MIKDKLPNLAPAVINCDFEQGVISAIRECFPNTSIRGCFFHLSQNMRKHLAHLGLVHEYDYNPEISLKEKMVRYMLYLYIPGVELVHET
jgi:hypothetical protein